MKLTLEINMNLYDSLGDAIAETACTLDKVSKFLKSEIVEVDKRNDVHDISGNKVGHFIVMDE